MTVGTFLKKKIMARARKIKILIRRQNNLFLNKPRQLFEELGGAASRTDEIPNADDKSGGSCGLKRTISTGRLLD